MSSAFDGQRAYDLVKQLAVDIGPRVMGSDAEKEACTLVQAYFERLGLVVSGQEYPVETGEHISHSAEVLDAPGGPILCFPDLLFPDTPDEGLAGELVYVEGIHAPQMGPHLEGKIVLWAPPPTHFSCEILEFKPAAVLRVCQDVGVAPRQFEMMGDDAKRWGPVPWFEIPYEEAVRLVRGGVRNVRLFHKSRCRPGTGLNVIGELRGTEHPEDIIVVGGHHDTVPNLPGATDNAAGCAVVMELARLFAERGGAKRTLRFATWGGEEGGLYGSREYVRRLKARDKEERAAPGFVKGKDKTEFERHLLSICLDVEGMTVGYSACFAYGPAELLATMSVLAAETGIEHEVSDRDYSSDYLPFVVAGIPSVAHARMGGATRYMHTPRDDMDLLDAGRLADAGRYIDTFLERVANAHVWPFKREIPDEIRKRLKDQLAKWGEENAEDWAR